MSTKLPKPPINPNFAKQQYEWAHQLCSKVVSIALNKRVISPDSLGADSSHKTITRKSKVLDELLSQVMKQKGVVVDIFAKMASGELVLLEKWTIAWAFVQKGEAIRKRPLSPEARELAILVALIRRITVLTKLLPLSMIRRNYPQLTVCYEIHSIDDLQSDHSTPSSPATSHAMSPSNSSPTSSFASPPISSPGGNPPASNMPTSPTSNVPSALPVRSGSFSSYSYNPSSTTIASPATTASHHPSSSALPIQSSNFPNSSSSFTLEKFNFFEGDWLCRDSLEVPFRIYIGMQYRPSFTLVLPATPSSEAVNIPHRSSIGASILEDYHPNQKHGSTKIGNVGGHHSSPGNAHQQNSPSQIGISTTATPQNNFTASTANNNSPTLTNPSHNVISTHTYAVPIPSNSGVPINSITADEYSAALPIRQDSSNRLNMQTQPITTPYDDNRPSSGSIKITRQGSGGAYDVSSGSGSGLLSSPPPSSYLPPASSSVPTGSGFSQYYHTSAISHQPAIGRSPSFEYNSPVNSNYRSPNNNSNAGVGSGSKMVLPEIGSLPSAVLDLGTSPDFNRPVVRGRSSSNTSFGSSPYRNDASAVRSSAIHFGNVPHASNAIPLGVSPSTASGIVTSVDHSMLSSSSAPQNTPTSGSTTPRGGSTKLAMYPISSHPSSHDERHAITSISMTSPRLQHHSIHNNPLQMGNSNPNTALNFNNNSSLSFTNSPSSYPVSSSSNLNFGTSSSQNSRLSWGISNSASNVNTSFLDSIDECLNQTLPSELSDIGQRVAASKALDMPLHNSRYEIDILQQLSETVEALFPSPSPSVQ